MIGFSHVTVMRDRHGKLRYRYRRKGCKTVYLHGLPGSPEFAAAYQRATGGKIEPGATRTVEGTLNALAVVVYASAEWRVLSKTTQATYRGIIERIRNDYGHLPVAGIGQGHVRQMRDKRAEKPTAANNFVKVLRWMLAIAVERKMRVDNPCIGIKPLKIEGDGFHTWTEAEVETFEKHWPVGTKQRTAFDLLLFTVQRSGDVRMMGRQHLAAGRLDFTQEKTGAKLSLPVVPALAASLETVPKDQMLFLVNQFGVGYTAKGFGNWFSEACRDAGLAQCSAHGLRKTGATRLADAGCSEAEIMAWTGHQTPKEVQRYTKARNQKGLADRAAARTETERTMATRPNLVDNPPSKALK